MSKRETKKRIVIDISFYFWSVCLFNHTNGLLELEQAVKDFSDLEICKSTYQTTWSDRENVGRIGDVIFC